MASVQFWVVIKDPVRRKRWERLLAQGGWTVASADLEEAARAAKSDQMGLALVDWALASASPSALRSLKASPGVLSILLTSSEKLSDAQVIEKLEAGADDYLPETLDGKLVLAKLNALLRRILPRLSGVLDVLQAPGGDLKLDRSRQEVAVKGSRGKWSPIAPLTPTEFQLLTLFLERPGTILERRFLLDTVWHDDSNEIRLGTIDKHIESLRRKLGPLGSRIQTVYGSGYAFKEAPPAQGAGDHR